jgi:hypothetical protein
LSVPFCGADWSDSYKARVKMLAAIPPDPALRAGENISFDLFLAGPQEK